MSLSSHAFERFEAAGGVRPITTKTSTTTIRERLKALQQLAKADKQLANDLLTAMVAACQPAAQPTLWRAYQEYIDVPSNNGKRRAADLLWPQPRAAAAAAVADADDDDDDDDDNDTMYDFNCCIVCVGLG